LALAKERDNALAGQLDPLWYDDMMHTKQSRVFSSISNIPKNPSLILRPIQTKDSRITGIKRYDFKTVEQG